MGRRLRDLVKRDRTDIIELGGEETAKAGLVMLPTALRELGISEQQAVRLIEAKRIADPGLFRGEVTWRRDEIDAAKGEVADMKEDGTL